MSVGVPARVRALLEDHAATLPRELGRALEPGLAFPALPSEAGVVVTGVGGSEGPARYLALLLQRAGRRAVFAPLSTYALAPRAAPGDALVVFSQGVSPNARLALRRAAEHRAAILFTSVDAARAAPEVRACLASFTAAGGEVVRLPPDDEPGTLVRLVGPAVALLAAARFAAGLPGSIVDAGALASVPALAASAGARAAEAAASLPPLALHRRLALVTAGPWLEGAHGLRSKWLEGLGAPEPPLWDVLQVAHGPFHEFFDEEITLVTLEHAGDEVERGLFDRLAAMLVAPRHTALRLRAALPPPLGALDHELLLTALLLRALGERSKDLGGALGSDAPLYGLGRDPA